MTFRIEKVDPKDLPTAAPDPLDEVQATLRDNMLASVRVLYAGVAAAMTPQNAARGMLLVERVSALQRHLIARLSGVVETGAPRRRSLGGVPFITASTGEPIPFDSPGAEEGVDGMPDADGGDIAGLDAEYNAVPATVNMYNDDGSSMFSGTINATGPVSPAVQQAVQSVLNASPTVNPPQPSNPFAQLAAQLQSFAVSEPDNETFGAEALKSILGAFDRYQKSTEPNAEKIKEMQVRSAKTLLEAARTLGDATLIERHEKRLRALLGADTGDPLRIVRVAGDPQRIEMPSEEQPDEAEAVEARLPAGYTYPAANPDRRIDS